MEIKVVYSDVEQALNTLKSSATNLETTVDKSDIGENVLDVTKKLISLNQTLEEVLVSYKDLIIENEVSTRKSVQVMKQADETIGASMK